MKRATTAYRFINALKRRETVEGKEIIKSFLYEHYTLHQFQKKNQEKLIDSLRLRKLSKGDTLFSEGDEVGIFSEIYVCLSGKLTIYKGKKVLGHLRSGDLFGESQDTRGGTVTVSSPECSLIAFPHELFHKLMKREDHFVLYTSAVRRTLMKEPRNRSQNKIKYTASFLRHFRFFENLNEELLLTIVSELELKHFEKQNTICEQGKPIDNIFFVLRGQVKILTHETNKRNGPHQYHLHRTNSFKSNKPKFNHFHSNELHVDHDHYFQKHLESPGNHDDGILHTGDVFGINENVNNSHNVYDATLIAKTRDVEILMLDQKLFSTILSFRNVSSNPTFMGSAKRALSVPYNHRGPLEIHTILRLLNANPLYKFFTQLPFISTHQISEVICYKIYSQNHIMYDQKNELSQKLRRDKQKENEQRHGSSKFTAANNNNNNNNNNNSNYSSNLYDDSIYDEYFSIVLTGVCIEENPTTKKKSFFYPGDCYLRETRIAKVNNVKFYCKERAEILYMSKHFFELVFNSLRTDNSSSNLIDNNSNNNSNNNDNNNNNICFQPSKIIPWLKLIKQEKTPEMLNYIATYLLKSNEFFSSIPYKIVKKIASNASIMNIPSSTCIVMEGSPASYACVILEGLVSIHYLGHSNVDKENARRAHELTEKEMVGTFGVRVANLHAGDCFGESVEDVQGKKDDLRNAPEDTRSASVISMMRSLVLKISKYHWNKYLKPYCRVNQISLFHNSHKTDVDYNILLKSLSSNAFFRQFHSKSIAQTIIKNSAIHTYRANDIICFENEESSECINIIIRGSVYEMCSSSVDKYNEIYKKYYKKSLATSKTLFASSPFFFRARNIKDMEDTDEFKIEEHFGKSAIEVTLTAGDSFECYEHDHPRTIIAGPLGASCLTIERTMWNEIVEEKYDSSVILQPEHLHRCLVKYFPSDHHLANGKNRSVVDKDVIEHRIDLLHQCLNQIAPEICQEMESEKWKRNHPSLNLIDLWYRKFDQEIVWRANEASTHVLIVIEGEIELRNNDEKVITTMSRGHFLGCIEVILEFIEGRPFTAYSSVETRCICIPRKVFKHLKFPKAFREKSIFFKTIVPKMNEKNIALLVYLSKSLTFPKGVSLTNELTKITKMHHHQNQQHHHRHKNNDQVQSIQLLYKGVAENISKAILKDGMKMKFTSALKIPGSIIDLYINDDIKDFDNIMVKSHTCQIFMFPEEVFGEDGFFPSEFLNTFKVEVATSKKWYENRKKHLKKQIEDALFESPAVNSIIQPKPLLSKQIMYNNTQPTGSGIVNNATKDNDSTSIALSNVKGSIIESNINNNRRYKFSTDILLREEKKEKIYSAVRPQNIKPKFFTSSPRVKRNIKKELESLQIERKISNHFTTTEIDVESLQKLLDESKFEGEPERKNTLVFEPRKFNSDNNAADGYYYCSDDDDNLVDESNPWQALNPVIRPKTSALLENKKLYKNYMYINKKREEDYQSVINSINKFYTNREEKNYKKKMENIWRKSSSKACI